MGGGEGGGGQKMSVFVYAQGIKTVHAGGGGQKMSVFVHAQGIKIVYAGVGVGQKMSKFCPRSC